MRNKVIIVLPKKKSLIPLQVITSSILYKSPTLQASSTVYSVRDRG